MRRRIYYSFIGLLLLCAVLLTSVICFIFFETAKEQEMASVKERTQIIADFMNLGYLQNDAGSYDRFNDGLMSLINGSRHSDRITVVSPDGAVLFDNVANPKTMDNHSGREELKAALENGSGESVRFSNTLGAMTYYYAVRLSDGNLLRLSKTIRGITGIFRDVLPMVVIVGVLALFVAALIARRLTARLVRPINDLDLDGDNLTVYDELSPLIRKIDRQKIEISEQLFALRNRANTIETITANIKEGLLLIDKNGVIIMANKGAMELFEDAGMVEKNVLMICRDLDLIGNVKRCLAGANMEMPFEWKEKIYDVYLSPVHSGGEEINGAVILFLNTTEKYEAEKQRKEFSANVSHELKTPLTTISALSEMISSGMAKGDDIKGFAAKISGQSKRLINIIDDIIRLSEFDEGNIAKELTLFDLRELAGLVIESLEDEARAKRVTVEMQGESLDIIANRRMLDQLLYNLIDNGIKYNKEQGSVIVTLALDGDECKISVRDTGIGIPREHHSRIFERFYRVDKSRSKRTGGTGLGLSIVKHIVEYHKGTIELSSEIGVGTTITCGIKRAG